MAHFHSNRLRLASAARVVIALALIWFAAGKSEALGASVTAVLNNSSTAVGEPVQLQIKVSGSAFSPTAVADFMSNLRASGKFKDVDLVVSRRDLARPLPLVTFEVTCRFEG